MPYFAFFANLSSLNPDVQPHTCHPEIADIIRRRRLAFPLGEGGPLAVDEV